MLRICRRGRADWLRSWRFAHRGLHGPGVPENTLPAFRLAAARGFGAELDVHLTRDGQLVVIHDNVLTRLCGDPRQVCGLTAAELRALPILGSQEHAPLLSEVLPLFRGVSPLVVEIKTEHGNAAPLTEAACRMLEASGVTFCLESFDPRVLLWLRRSRPDIPRGQLSCDFFKPENKNELAPPLRFVLSGLYENFLTLPDFIAYRWEDRGRAAAVCRRYGAQEVSWTIRTRRDLEAAERDGCAVIFEGFLPDRPRP